MEPIIIYPKNSRQSSLIKALLEEMQVKFKPKVEEKDTTLLTKEEFHAKVNRASRQAEAGKKIKLTPELENELFGSSS
jgi:hypothetical protein